MTVDGAPRTAAATVASAEARRLAKSNRLCAELTSRLPEMPDDMVNALAIVVLEEFYRRRR